MGAGELRVGGITAFTATDFPGKLAAAVFIQGCPWRCGYCHNPHLQLRQHGPLTWASVMALLVRRAGLLDGVVFSGGEPTMDPALPDAMAAVRELGLAVGLHTACIYPRQLKAVLPLVDWVGFDIKAPFDAYQRVTGVFGSGEPARACLEMIVDSGVPHECRTTLHPALLSEAEVEGLAGTLADAGVRNYAIQTFRAQGCADAGLNATAGVVMGEAALARIAARFESFVLRPA
ncbi:anaerobic ribonucleoside-triphosphate reductase activating protein [Massilia pseudoviolaceinigra]|uniref:anaerobic ribonucleoside-triphosphate reductase activating protein n=1 Tax=Massilia pseudoviolaceinigra TaxID=3057165 RepID=UPI0027968399|nr:anaerobic ribonucleoside-triphosphate reductase activating protein [Massilia sp. CCM 9206]MDQ1923532.1 anaerobic ribonucleoside-triphosphate reductase activating protein [Massilia sp. CCM 9206]